MRRVTYGGFLSSLRTLRAHIMDPDSSISVESHPDGFRLMPVYDQAGTEKKQALERSLAEVQLAADREETILAAALVYRMTYRLAAARALHGLPLRSQITRPFYDAQLDFLNEARRELRLSATSVDGFGPEARLVDVDRDLRKKFQAPA
jgi:hypothetical protein